MLKIEYENLNKVNKPFFKEYRRAYRKVMRSGRFILGENVRKFEQEFAEYCGVKYCAGVASGMDALTLSLRVLCPEGGEVIVASNVYTPCVFAILHAGCTPVFCEPDIETYNINPEKIKITPETVAVMVVHMYGHLCDMVPIVQICKDNNIALLEDCSHAHGAAYAGKHGNMGAFSFYPTKNLGALGDGGAIVTNNKEHHEKILALRNYGSGEKYLFKYPGFNSRLDELQAAFLRIKLKNLNGINRRKKEIANIYDWSLGDVIYPPPDGVCHIYNIRHERRDELRAYLFGRGIGTEIHYPVPPQRQEALGGYGFCPLADEISNTTLSLPISYHSDKEIQQVIEAIKWFT